MPVEEWAGYGAQHPGCVAQAEKCTGGLVLRRIGHCVVVGDKAFDDDDPNLIRDVLHLCDCLVRMVIEMHDKRKGAGDRWERTVPRTQAK